MKLIERAAYILFIVLLCLPLDVAFSQEPDAADSQDSTPAKAEPAKSSASEQHLDEYVVTATKTESLKEEVPGRVEVITKDQLQGMAIQTVDQALERIAGVKEYRPAGIYNFTSTTTMRGVGLDQGRVLVLEDGVPINKSDSGGVLWNRLNIDDVERIEVFKGAASSLYGNAAMGGVINIITKRPKQRFESDLGTAGGTYDTWKSNGSIGGRLSEEQGQGFYGRASGQYLTSEGYKSVPASKNPTVDHINTNVDEKEGTGRIGYDFDERNNIDFKYSRYGDFHGEGLKYRLDDGVNRQFDNDFFQVNYAGGHEKTSWGVNSYYQLEDYQRNNESLSSGRNPVYTHIGADSDRTDAGVMAFVAQEIGKNTVTFGIDSKYGDTDATDSYTTSPDHITNKGELYQEAAYIQDESRLFNDKLIILAGLRYDFAEFANGHYYSTVAQFSRYNGALNENSWGAWSPRFSAKYFFTEDVSAYASYARGFRAPTLDSLTRTGARMGNKTQVANPNLGPEKMDSFEAGSDWWVTKKLKLSATGYYSKGHDFMYMIENPTNIVSTQNVGGVTIYGSELEAKYSLLDNLSLFANYTYDRSYINDFSGSPNIEGNTLTFTPRNMVNAGVDWLNEWANASFLYHYEGERFGDDANQVKLGARNTVDIKLWREFFDHFTASLSVENIFNNRSLEDETTISPGRFIMAGVKWTY